MFRAPVYDIGTKLRRARRERGFTLKAVQLALGYSTALISNIERGLTPKRLRTLQDYANHLGVDISPEWRELQRIAVDAAASLTGSGLDADLTPDEASERRRA